jgi:hypothetical protein
MRDSRDQAAAAFFFNVPARLLLVAFAACFLVPFTVPSPVGKAWNQERVFGNTGLKVPAFIKRSDYQSKLKSSQGKSASKEAHEIPAVGVPARAVRQFVESASEIAY